MALSRREVIGATLFLAVGGAYPAQAGPAEDFARFVEGLWPEAKAQGISRATFDKAFAGVAPNEKLIAQSRKQSEFTRPVWEYLDGVTAKARVNRGAALAQQWSRTIGDIERRFGVPRQAMLGVWGMESNFGSFTGGAYVVQALASLAFGRHRSDYFRNELLAALRILQQDHISRDMMLGSWAGAMGQTQFMPSSFEKYAVDGDGDDIRNIWTSVPDALASIANYLHLNNWDPALPWGFEAVLPQGFDFTTHRAAFSEWSRLGLRRADGLALPRSGEAQLLVLSGASGPIFLVTDNFEAIRAYNMSDAYALGVGILGDMIYGGSGIRASWPRNAPRLTGEERKEVQLRLERQGFYQGKHDGNHGWQTRAAIRAFQAKHGLLADGYADPKLLAALRQVK